ncbi:predicted protein [Sclerotinia sclerotiorum 1980 UF-70]|uniref:Uncharacterized protein n=1 Tax=Sclerotinia sclerotiorum (strain ATCC 18683 / 1980 / Ss-1) TaxID=665079 RepID=A7EIP4_SCLS1|nr:predicted protein [Sclerotinia sclerotiorum 1980 UF-70]EDO02710.1 predicted protein [Sclerotinia sclerotiorum 1980 UF-70]
MPDVNWEVDYRKVWVRKEKETTVPSHAVHRVLCQRV